MNVVLIDHDGSAKEMTAEYLPVRQVRLAPLTVVADDDLNIPVRFDTVEFRDSGLRDASDRIILTPDGKDVPLFHREVYRLGAKVALRIVASTRELARFDASDGREAWLWGIARLALAKGVAKARFLGVQEQLDRATDETRTFTVYAQQYEAVT